MNLTDTEILKFMRGSPVFLDDICAVYPATLGEIIDLGYNKFQIYLSVITATKPVLMDQKENELQKLLDQLTDFQYILMLTSLDAEANQHLKESFRFFCHSEVTFSLELLQIFIGPLEEKHILTEEKFYDLQKIIKHMYFLEVDGDEIIINPDDDPMTRRMKIKMIKNREAVRKAKAKKTAREGTDLSFSDLIGSLTINNCGLNIANIWDITYYAFYDQLKRMGWRDQFDINNRAAMAGAKLKESQLKHWIRSITDSSKS